MWTGSVDECSSTVQSSDRDEQSILLGVEEAMLAGVVMLVELAAAKSVAGMVPSSHSRLVSAPELDLEAVSGHSRKLDDPAG